MNTKYLEKAINITLDNIESGGRPFGAVIVKNDEIIATAVNTMLQDNDPTAHAELSAIRKAGAILQTVDLSDCVIYASGEPCPMCQAAMYMAGIREVYYAYSNDDGKPYQLSTAHIAKEMQKLPNERTNFHFTHVNLEKEGLNNPHLYQKWADKNQ